MRALLARGDVMLARDAIERLVAAPRRTLLHRGVHLVAHADLLIAADAVSERARIESSLGEAADLAQRMGTLPLHATVRTTRARLARALGDEAGRERELRAALRIYTEMDATGWMERTEQELAS